MLCASPEYLQRRGEPETLDDLQDHDGIVYGNLLEGNLWRVHGPEGAVSVPINGRIAADSMGFILHATLSGFGLALLPEGVARGEIKAGRLKRVLAPYATTGGVSTRSTRATGSSRRMSGRFSTLSSS